ncbi:hypothetical protein [Halorubrum ezzemoulense]|nr:hypothetical protein [Halorubrum ezzemoulense]
MVGEITTASWQLIATIATPISYFLLTGSLAYLYYQQYRVQQRNQNAQISPVISTETFKFDQNNIDVLLSNHGAGLAKNIRIVCILECESEDIEIVPVKESLEMDDPTTGRTDRVLRAGETRYNFSGVVISGIREDSQDYNSSTDFVSSGFSGITRVMKNEYDIDEASLTLEIHYENVLDECEKIQILETEYLDLEEYTTLSEFKQKADLEDMRTESEIAEEIQDR